MSAIHNAFVFLKSFAQRTFDVPEAFVTITCPSCSSVLTVRDESGGLSVPDVKCGCGTLINSNLSYFSSV